jgi:hypothetical protein
MTVQEAADSGLPFGVSPEPLGYLPTLVFWQLEGQMFYWSKDVWLPALYPITLYDKLGYKLVDWFEPIAKPSVDSFLATAMKAVDEAIFGESSGMSRQPLHSKLDEILLTVERRPCTCDLRSVIMVTGCRCGGT